MVRKRAAATQVTSRPFGHKLLRFFIYTLRPRAIALQLGQNDRCRQEQDEEDEDGDANGFHMVASECELPAG